MRRPWGGVGNRRWGGWWRWAVQPLGDQDHDRRQHRGRHSQAREQQPDRRAWKQADRRDDHQRPEHRHHKGQESQNRQASPLEQTSRALVNNLRLGGGLLLQKGPFLVADPAAEADRLLQLILALALPAGLLALRRARRSKAKAGQGLTPDRAPRATPCRSAFRGRLRWPIGGRHRIRRSRPDHQCWPGGRPEPTPDRREGSGRGSRSSNQQARPTHRRDHSAGESVRQGTPMVREERWPAPASFGASQRHRVSRCTARAPSRRAALHESCQQPCL